MSQENPYENDNDYDDQQNQYNNKLFNNNISSPGLENNFDFIPHQLQIKNEEEE